MNNLKSLIASLVVLTSFSSIADSNEKNNLIIQAIPESEGTVVIKGQPKYEKSFRLTVLNASDIPNELTGFVGCYKAFDEKGKEFDTRVIDASLLGKLKEGAKEGSLTFVSDDESVYKAKFVKWSTGTACPHLAERKSS